MYNTGVCAETTIATTSDVAEIIMVAITEDGLNNIGDKAWQSMIGIVFGGITMLITAKWVDAGITVGIHLDAAFAFELMIRE